MLSFTQFIGRRAEKIAYDFLRKQGLSYIARNFLTRHGEIDLIMKDKNEIIFVEVRYRKNEYFGNAIETVGFKKRQRLIKAAYAYLLRNKAFTDFSCRFDVVAVNKNSEISWIKNAFDVQY